MRSNTPSAFFFLSSLICVRAPQVVDDGAEHRFRALVTFGTLACGGATIKSAVRSAAPADVVARLSMPGVAAEAAEDLLRHLSS